MDAADEPPIQNIAVEGVKVNVNSSEGTAENNTLVQSDVCQKTNGIGDTNEAEPAQAPSDDSTVQAETCEQSQPSDTIKEEENEITVTETVQENKNDTSTEDSLKETSTDLIPEDENTTAADVQGITPKNDDVSEELQEGDVEIDGIVEKPNDNVLFETEILIETNVDDQSGTKYKVIYDDDEPDHTNNILNELGQNIELSEVLRSSDVTENVENNNSEVSQEVFNKEELLDILEGNDVEESRKVIYENFQNDCKKLESQLALQQLSRLKSLKKSRTPKKSDKKNSKKNISPKDENVKKKVIIAKEDQSSQSPVEVEVAPKEESIVNALVKDWEDEEPTEGDGSNKVIEEDKTILKETDKIVDLQTSITVNNESNASITDVSVRDDHTENKNSSDSQPQRRLGRVIKKKVIFDPDNPDTFTKTKVPIKKENQSDKEQPTPKKVKVEVTSTPTSKSPIQTKLQWKKPQSKNNKKCNRLTEIDKLLMDEGAVNMICQLTPEAPKGHKNMKSKAEFIKKIQSSTPDSKEMKFRERKKESKHEDGEPRKIGSVKERLSMSGSVKSPTVSEDFEAHSADDSIIYRRHSSSSYSSSCMSPRRLSDVENVTMTTPQTAATDDQSPIQGSSTKVGDVFMAESQDIAKKGIINKKDLLSIKEKLNSKLSMALNKRKRESTKGEKPSKIKKVTKTIAKPEEKIVDYKYIKVTGDKKLVEICILHPGPIFSIELIKELKAALEVVEANKDISVTLLTSESGSLCSGLDLRPLLDQDNGSNYAQQLAESARELLCTLQSHSKLVCTAIGDKCQGLGLSIVALSDVTLASDRASFELSPHKNGPLVPGVAVLMASGLPQHLLNDLVVFDRCIAAADALRGGLITRTIWPEKYLDQVRAFAEDMAARPKQNILLKKQLLRLKRGASGSILSDLEKERDLFIKYWTSEEGRELVRVNLAGA